MLKKLLPIFVSLILLFSHLPSIKAAPTIQATADPYILPPADVTIMALRNLYTSTNGGNWQRDDNWPNIDANDPYSVCKWFGVICYDYKEYNDAGEEFIQIYVHRLHLINNNLSGPFPKGLSVLPKLYAMQFSNNSLTGPLPNNLNQFFSLTHLDVQDNQLSGPVPAGYFEMLQNNSRSTLTLKYFAINGNPDLGTPIGERLINEFPSLAAKYKDFELTQGPIFRGLFGDKSCLIVDKTITDFFSGIHWMWHACNTENNSCPEGNSGPNCMAGNPMNIRQGIKQQSELDFSSQGLFALQLKRTYNSAKRQWAFNDFDAFVWDYGDNNHKGVSLGNGRTYYFVKSSSDTWLATKAPNESTAYQGYILKKVATGYRFIKPRGDSLDFNDAGELIAKNSVNGFTHHVVKTSNSHTVSDDFGVSYTLTYNALKQPVSLTTPQGLIQYGYDVDGLLVSVTYPDNTIRQYHYDEPIYSTATHIKGLLTGIIDANGDRYASWHYDNTGRVWQSKHGSNADTTTIVYFDNGVQPIRDETTATGARKRYYLDSEYGQRAEKIEYYDLNDTLLGTESYQYNSFGHTAQKTDIKGTITRYTRDTYGREYTRIEAADTGLARTITTEYLGGTSLPAKVTTAQLITQYTYTTTQQISQISRTDVASGEIRTTRYQYNANNLLIAVDGPRIDVSDVTTFTYNPQGWRTKTVNALGHAREVVTFDTSGQPLSIKEANGTITTLSYNSRSWLVSRTNSGLTINYEYDAQGQQSAIHLPGGQTIAYEYDSAHRLVAIVDAQNNRLEYTLDGAGNRIKTDIKDKNGVLQQTSQQSFDHFGRLQSLIGASGNTQTYSHNPAGELVSQTDALNYQTTHKFNALGHMVTTTDANGNATFLGVDNAGRNTAVIDVQGKNTRYQYNGFGEVTEQHSPDSGTTRFIYDQAGNLTQKVQVELAQTSQYQFDALNRILTDSATGAGYIYDDTSNGNFGIGQLTSVADNSGSQQLTYNAIGRVIRDIRTIAGHQFTVLYHYNASNQLVGMTYPSGRVINYTNNTLNQITVISTGEQTLAENIQYLPFGPLKYLQYGNGLQLSRSFDLDYRQVGQTLSGLEAKTIAYTPRNNIQSIGDIINPSYDQTLMYSPMQRLTNAQGSHGVIDYSHDAIGNRLSKVDDGQTATYSYVAGKHHIGTIAGSQNVTFSHNGGGQIFQKGDMALSYDAAQRLSSSETLGITTNYQYNYRNRRVAKANAQATTYYLYDLQSNLIGEAKEDGTVAVEYVYLEEQLVAMVHNPVIIIPGPEDIAIDDDSGAKTGSWSRSKSRKAFNGYHQLTPGSSGATLRWTADVIGGSYQVYARWVANRKNSKNANYTIHHGGQISTAQADQTNDGAQWQLLGTFDFNGRDFDAPASEFIELDDSNGKVSADAIRLVRIADLPPEYTPVQWYYVHNNHIGTPTRLTNANAEAVWQAYYTPFGLANINDDVDGNARPITFNVRFPGQYFDSESALHYNWHRYYDPQTGRYITSDPIGLAAGLSTYGYVGANPVNQIDPTGLCAGLCVGTVVGARLVYQGYKAYRAIQMAKALQAAAAAAVASQSGCDSDEEEGEEDCAEAWKQAEERCRELIDEVAQQQLGKRKKRHITGVTGGYSEIRQCARGLVSESCGGNRVVY